MYGAGWESMVLHEKRRHMYKQLRSLHNLGIAWPPPQRGHYACLPIHVLWQGPGLQTGCASEPWLMAHGVTWFAKRMYSPVVLLNAASRWAEHAYARPGPALPV